MAMSGVRIMWHLSRPFSCSCVLPGKELQGRFMLKLLSNKLERKLQQTHSARHAVKVLDNRKTAILNKFYMENVTQALAFSGFEGIAEKGVQVTRVSVKNTGTVEVYWLANENEDPSEVQNLLTSLAGKVGNKLTYANMAGFVPHLVFKRDLGSLHLAEVEKRLNKVGQENEIYQKLMDSKNPVDAEAAQDMDPDCPIMRMDVFGLPHDKILRRIHYGKKNSHLFKVPTPISSEEILESAFSDPTSQSDLKDSLARQKELKKFITAYQKSSLSSSAQRCKDQKLLDTDLYYDDDSDDLHYDSNFDENWEENDRK